MRRRLRIRDNLWPAASRHGATARHARLLARWQLVVGAGLTILKENALAEASIGLISDRGFDDWLYRGSDWLVTLAGPPNVDRKT